MGVGQPMGFTTSRFDDGVYCEILQIREMSDCALTLFYSGSMYGVAAFPMENGIGNRKIIQWDRAYLFAHSYELGDATRVFNRWRDLPQDLKEHIIKYSNPVTPKWA